MREHESELDLLKALQGVEAALEKAGVPLDGPPTDTEESGTAAETPFGAAEPLTEESGYTPQAEPDEAGDAELEDGLPEETEQEDAESLAADDLADELADQPIDEPLSQPEDETPEAPDNEPAEEWPEASETADEEQEVSSKVEKAARIRALFADGPPLPIEEDEPPEGPNAFAVLPEALPEEPNGPPPDEGPAPPEREPDCLQPLPGPQGEWERERPAAEPQAIEPPTAEEGVLEPSSSLPPPASSLVEPQDSGGPFPPPPEQLFDTEPWPADIPDETGPPPGPQMDEPPAQQPLPEDAGQAEAVEPADRPQEPPDETAPQWTPVYPTPVPPPPGAEAEPAPEPPEQQDLTEPDAAAMPPPDETPPPDGAAQPPSAPMLFGGISGAGSTAVPDTPPSQEMLARKEQIRQMRIQREKRKKQIRIAVVVLLILCALVAGAVIFINWQASKAAEPSSVPASMSQPVAATSVPEASLPASQPEPEPQPASELQAGQLPEGGWPTLSFTEEETARLNTLLDEWAARDMPAVESSSSNQSDTEETSLAPASSVPLDPDAGHRVAVYFYDLHSGAAYMYNQDQKFFIASLSKAPYALYLYQLVDSGAASLTQMYTITPEDAEGSAQNSGTIKDDPDLPKDYTLEELVGYMLRDSDTLAQRTLLKAYPADGYAQWASELGLAYPEDVRGVTSGNVTATDAGVYLNALYQYMETGAHGAMLKEHMMNGRNAMIKSDAAVAHKYGWDEGAYHDMAVVYGEHPYLLAILTDKDNGAWIDLAMFQTVTAAFEEIMNAKWAAAA